MQSRGVSRPSVCPSVNFFCANRYFYHKHEWIATKLAHDGPHMDLHPGCAQDQGQGQRSRDTGTSVMSRNVCYTLPSDVLSLHALTLRSTVTLSFQYKWQTARCNVYIMEWATPSLTVWFQFHFTCERPKTRRSVWYLLFWLIVYSYANFSNSIYLRIKIGLKHMPTRLQLSTTHMKWQT